MYQRTKPLSRSLPFFSLLLSLFFFGVSCKTTLAPSKEIGSTDERLSQKNKEAAGYEIIYYIFRDGEFVEDTLDLAPEPLGGFTNLFHQANFSYPARAREIGLQGTVWMTIVVDEFGKVEEYNLKKGIGAGCDEECLRMMNYAKEIGFNPPLQNGIPVKVKFDVPFRFVLQ